MKAVAMQVLVAAALALLWRGAQASASASAETSPVSKVLELLASQEGKIVAEGEKAQKIYSEAAEACEERSKQLGFDIKTAKGKVAELKATIEKESSTVTVLSSKVEDISGTIATADADLKAATEIRTKEGADFETEAKELTEIVDTLQRAIGLLEKEMAKGGGSAALAQLNDAGGVVQALSAMVQASVLSSADARRLTALVQTSQGEGEGEAEESLGAPAAAIYKSQSGGIVQTLEDLLEKAEAELADARKKETSALHSYEMLKQSLEDEIKYATKDLGEAKKGITASSEMKAAAEGDLSMTTKDLDVSTTTLSDLHRDCMMKAEDFEAAVKSRGAELKALAEAKKVVSEQVSGSGADALTYGLNQVSFLQRSSSRLSSGSDLARFEAVRFLRNLSKKQHSPALAQLASRVASVMSSGAGVGEDPFGKVKGLISEMIAKLESEAGAEADHKAYCDKELAETSAKKEEKGAEISKLSTKIDVKSSRSAQLKEEVAELSKAMAELAASQAEMDKVRKEENDLFLTSKTDLEGGIEAVKLALKILREYYATEDKSHTAAEGASTGIIGLLEVVEADFSKGLAEITATETSAQAAYEQQSKDNELEKTTKEQDVAYKTKESKDLDKAMAELSTDLAGVQEEQDAVLEYWTKLQEQCIAKAEPYEERKARREAELAGLKEAIKILESEAVLLQSGSSRRVLRGVRRHRLA